MLHSSMGGIGPCWRGKVDDEDRNEVPIRVYRFGQVPPLHQGYQTSVASAEGETHMVATNCL